MWLCDNINNLTTLIQYCAEAGGDDLCIIGALYPELCVSIIFSHLDWCILFNTFWHIHSSSPDWIGKYLWTVIFSSFHRCSMGFKFGFGWAWSHTSAVLAPRSLSWKDSCHPVSGLMHSWVGFQEPLCHLLLVSAQSHCPSAEVHIPVVNMMQVMSNART